MSRMLFALVMTAAPLLGSDAATVRGFDHFYNLEYEEAKAEFEKAIQAEPRNPETYNHLAQAILYREMLHAGALESELVTGNNPFLHLPKIKPSAKDLARFDECIAKAIALAQGQLNRNGNDTKAMYTLGIAIGLRSNINFLVRKYWIDSLRDATAARKLHNRVTEIEPSNIDARLVQGLHDYVVGSLPFHYKLLGFLAGFHGDRDRGMRTVTLVAEKGNLNKLDAKVLLAALYRRERRAQDAIPLLDELVQRMPRNYLLYLEQVQMFADLGRMDDGLRVLAQLEEMKRAGKLKTMPVEKIYYSRGNLLFWYREFDAALANLGKATANTKDLDLNTTVNAWLRTGQSLDMKGQRAMAVNAYRRAIAEAPDSDAGKEAKKYLSSPYRRTER
jgi:tetratricopeptide (TPR) repeat protein